MTTARSILEKLVEECNRCEGGDCYNCGQKPLNIDDSIASLTTLLLEALPKEIYFKGSDSPQNNYREQRSGYNQAISDCREAIKKVMEKNAYNAERYCICGHRDNRHADIDDGTRAGDWADVEQTDDPKFSSHTDNRHQTV